MDRQRAQEIIQSPQKITVEYEGTPVWIDAVDESGFARVHVEGEPDQRKEVEVAKLVERQ